MKGCVLAEFLYHRLEQAFAELIARTAKKKHRDGDVVEMIGSFRVRRAGRMKRKGEQDNSFQALQWRLRRGGRRHSSAERMSTGEQRQIRRGLPRGSDG